MAQGKFVAYYRVSTAKQGRSGLGLEAQRKAVADFLNGGNWRLLTEHTEIESGKNDERPELAKAINDCRLRNATLVIAKLDRLTRDLHFLTGLQRAGIRFAAADMPEANELTVHIIAAMAQHERKMISARTKAALAAAKARGTRLGNPHGIPAAAQAKGAPAGMAARQAKAAERAVMLRPVIEDIRAAGKTSLRAIAAELNAREIPAPRGGQWASPQVLAVLRRVAP